MIVLRESGYFVHPARYFILFFIMTFNFTIRQGGGH